MAKHENIVVGLDIGTTKTCVIVGVVSTDGKVKIIGVGSAPSKGLKKGVVVDIEETVESIKKAVEEAERMADVRIHSVYVGIAGGHIQGHSGHGVILIKGNEVSRADIEHVTDAAQASVQVPMDREILHVIHRGFVVDGQAGIRDPLGLSGGRLEVDIHVVTGAVTSAQNIVKSLERAGLAMMRMVLQPLASSEATLTMEEKELGVVLVDIGGGTTDVAIFMEGGVRHTAVFAIGGSNFTKDIAIGLHTPLDEAERIKIKYGAAWSDLVEATEVIEVQSMGGRPTRILSRHVLADIMEPRAEEIFNLVAREIDQVGQDRVASGVVITGGGVCMPGIVDVAEKVLGLPARSGNPHDVIGLIDMVSSPIYSTGVGLILYPVRNAGNQEIQRTRKRTTLGQIRHMMKSWVKEFF